MATNKFISDFKTSLSGGGARPNLFEVTFGNIPSAAGTLTLENFIMLCKASNLPGSTVASIDVPFRGRIFKVSGDRTFDPWSITVINDNDFAIRKVMEDWMQHIAQYKDASGTTDPSTYMANATVQQLSRNSSTVSATSGGGATVIAREYTFQDIFPTSVSAIDLSADSSNAIEEFTVEFQVNYWYPSGTGGKTN
jgi:hypothetical protein